MAQYQPFYPKRYFFLMVQPSIWLLPHTQDVWCRRLKKNIKITAHFQAFCNTKALIYIFFTYDEHNTVFKNIWRNNELQNKAFRFRGPTHPLPPDLLGCCSVKANIINGSDLLMQGADGCRYEVPISTGLSGIYRPSRSGRGGNRAAPLRALGEPVHLKNRLQ